MKTEKDLTVQEFEKDETFKDHYEEKHPDRKLEENDQMSETDTTDFEDDFLLDEGKAEHFRARWMDIQTSFIDSPQDSVETADQLVSDVMTRITDNLSEMRSALEEQWREGEEPSTEELRKTMKHYRAFFNRMLTLEYADEDDFDW